MSRLSVSFTEPCSPLAIRVTAKRNVRFYGSPSDDVCVAPRAGKGVGFADPRVQIGNF